MQQDATRFEKKRVELRSRGSAMKAGDREAARRGAAPKTGPGEPVSSARRFRKSCERHPFTFIPRRAEGVRREGRGGEKKRFERKRGQKNEDNGPAEQQQPLGARKKAVGVLGGDHETSRVIPRWNLVKQSSLETTRTRTLLRGPPGCLIKIEVVRCFSLSLSLSCCPLPPALSNPSLSHVPRRREEREKERERGREERSDERERTTTVPSRTHGCVFPFTRISRGSVCSLLVLFRDATRVYMHTFTCTRMYIVYFRLCVCARLFLRLFAAHVRRARGARERAGERAPLRPRVR